MDSIELKYAMLLSNRLERFKVVSHNPYRINFRCPYCGDSAKSKTKARGWFTETKTGKFRASCFNCGHSVSFYDFLKQQDPMFFKDYVVEKFVKPEKSKQEIIKKETPVPNVVLKGLKKISQLSSDHPAKKYITSRKIPPNKHYLIYYAPKFKTWINSIIPDKFSSSEKDEPRLVFPFFDKDGTVFGISARSFDPKSNLRYITIMFNPDKPKFFGLKEVDWNKPYYITEGVIDSMFLPNAIAMAGADGNLNGLEKIENARIVFDCEPRNKEIHSRMKKMIDKKVLICIWPSYMQQKDINEMVLNGITNVTEIIEQNSFRGLEAELRLNEWRKR